MTTIYEEADFTIVAAAGAGAGHGLPGVGRRPREAQPKYHLNSGKMLLSILRDPRRDILESQYWTRGWTYQEGVLSNRRIVFTEQQVYWECRCMAAHESAGVSQFLTPQTDDENSDWIMANFMLTGIFKGAVYSGGVQSEHEKLVIATDDAYRLEYGFSSPQEITVRGQLRGLNEHIRAFSKRRLTHDSDSLLAFQGLVGMYQQTKELYLFQGIPMWMGKVAGNSFGARITFALSVSSWYHRSGPQQLMYSAEVCRRKTDFPSWTWAGWAGTVTWRAPPNLEHCAYMSDLIKAKSLNLLWTADVSLGSPTTTARMRPINMYSTACLNNEAPSLIEIKGPLLLYAFERVEETKKEWSWAPKLGRPGRERITTTKYEWDAKWYRIGRRLSCIGMSVAMTEKEWTEKHVSGEPISVLIFTEKYPDNEHGSARFLTLRKVTSFPERWERVGTLYLVIPFLAGCQDMHGFFRKVPAARGWRSSIVIQ